MLWGVTKTFWMVGTRLDGGGPPLDGGGWGKGGWVTHYPLYWPALFVLINFSINHLQISGQLDCTSNIGVRTDKPIIVEVNT